MNMNIVTRTVPVACTNYLVMVVVQGVRGNAVIHFIILPEDSTGDSD